MQARHIRGWWMHFSRTRSIKPWRYILMINWWRACRPQPSCWPRTMLLTLMKPSLSIGRMECPLTPPSVLLGLNKANFWDLWWHIGESEPTQRRSKPWLTWNHLTKWRKCRTWQAELQPWTCSSQEQQTNVPLLQNLEESRPRGVWGSLPPAQAIYGLTSYTELSKGMRSYTLGPYAWIRRSSTLDVRH